MQTNHIEMSERKTEDKEDRDLLKTILKLSITATLASLGIILSSIVILIPNFEFISVSIFLISLLFGVYYGIIATTAVSLVYEFLVTPIYGPSGLILPFKLICYFILAIVVGLSRRKLIKLSGWELGIIGSLFALIYDIITTFGGMLVIFVTSIQANLTANITIASFLALIISGAPFTIAHIIGNFVLFSLTKTIINWIISAFRYRGVKMLMIDTFIDLQKGTIKAGSSGETT